MSIILLNEADLSSIFQSNLSVIGFSDIDVEDVWITKLPKLTTESALRLMDVNNDNVLDIVLGFATGRWPMSFVGAVSPSRNVGKKCIQIYLT